MDACARYARHFTMEVNSPMSGRPVNSAVGVVLLWAPLFLHAETMPAAPALRPGVLHLWAESPQIAAAEAALSAIEAGVRGAAKPLYNPELEFEYQSAVETETSVGIRQAIDWAGKRDARSAAAGLDLNVALAELRREKLDLAMSWLRAAARYSFALSRQDLAERKLGLTKRFREVASRRVAGGDLRQSDANLALLASVDAIAGQAIASNELADARAQAAALTGDSRIEIPLLTGVPEPQGLVATQHAEWLPRLPALTTSTSPRPVSRWSGASAGPILPWACAAAARATTP